MSQAASHANQLEDLRASLAAQASRAEQRNRPRALLLIAAIILIIGAWFGWSGYSRSTEAEARAAAAQRYSDNVLKAAGKLKALESQGAIEGYAPMTSLLSRIESHGTPAGLKSRVPIGSSQTRPGTTPTTKAWKSVRTTYTIRDPHLPAVLKWIDLVVADIPGMEVHSITIRPEANDWVVIVVFSRWERAEGGS